MKSISSPMIKALGVLMLGYGYGCASEELIERPNVLFISVDDLNDWIEPMGGHPQTKTPNLNLFAKKAVVFANAYCPSPSSNPSRTALLTGQPTYRSGMYSNYQLREEVFIDAVTLPKHFSNNGYFVAGAGKIFHNDQPDPHSWDDYWPSKENHMPTYYMPKPGSTVNMPKFESMYGAFDWSPIPLKDEETADYKVVQWVIDQLNRDHDKPFFLAAGIYRPHLPWYVPEKYYDMFPVEDIQLPVIYDDDLDDLGERALEIIQRGGNYHNHVIEAGQWENAVQGYLASIAFADAMVGRLLEGLEASKYAENTIIVLWSDHGWQLGQKEHWRKFALWENVLKTPMIIYVPEKVKQLRSGSKRGGLSRRITSLMDIYPTLIELCGFSKPDNVHGNSLVPLLVDPSAEWNYPAISTYDPFEYSIRTQRYRYINYIDGSEELYDHENDPHEWFNLANDPEFTEILEKMREFKPKDPAPFVHTNYALWPHHEAPFTSREEYMLYKETGFRDLSKWKRRGE